MSKPLTLLAGLVGVGILTFLCANRHRPDIEADLTAKTRTHLAANGFDKVNTAAEGQIITLTGRVADAAAKEKAGLQAASIFGVSEVRNLLEVEPVVVTPPVMTPEQRTQAISCQDRFTALLKEPILFETGKAVIHRRSYPLLEKLTAAAAACPVAEVEIGGHTDSRGSREMNLKLSQNRAEAVARYLTGKGIDAKRLTPVGHGPDEPVADNKTAAGMQKNRRTEFKVKGIQ